MVALAKADLREVIETTTSGDVACLIAEPIQGVGGFVVPPDGFFGAMQEVLDDYGLRAHFRFATTVTDAVWESPR